VHALKPNHFWTQSQGQSFVVKQQEKRYKLIYAQCKRDAAMAAQLQAEEWEECTKRLASAEMVQGCPNARPVEEKAPEEAEVSAAATLLRRDLRKYGLQGQSI